MTITADEALAPDRKSPGPSADELEGAKEFLRETLADGPNADVITAAQDEGIAERTLRRALVQVGGTANAVDSPAVRAGPFRPIIPATMVPFTNILAGMGKLGRNGENPMKTNNPRGLKMSILPFRPSYS